MLKDKLPALLPILALAGLVALSLPEALAQVPLYTPAWQSPPRDCTIGAGTTASVRIVAGPDSSQPSGLAAAFPVTEPCPAPFSGTCRRWDYKWTFTGVNPSHSIVSVDTDVQVLAAAPTAVPSFPIVGDSPTGFGVNIAGEVGLRFNANADTLFASIWTPQGVGVGTVTAGFQSGKARGFCAIAGADNPVGDPGLSLNTRVETSTLGCTVVWTLSPDGCPVSAEVTSGSCEIKNTDLGLGTNTASCATELNVPGSTQVCRWNSLLRSYTCVTVQ
jgi:hypothetical protein